MAGIAIGAALTLGIYSAVAGRAHDSHPTAGRRPSAAASPCSAAAGWRLKLAGTWSEPTEQNTAPLEVTRTGSQSCTLRGYPQVALLGAGGHTLGFRYSHRGDLVVARRAAHVVHVAVSGSAFFLLNKNSCVSREVKLARRLQVDLPGVHGRLVLRLPRYPLLGYCPTRLPHEAVDPGMVVTVSPLVADLAQATARLP